MAQYGIAPSGFRLPATARPGRVRLQVSDLSRSLDYYKRVIGMRVLSRDAGHAGLGAQADDRVLVELQARAGARPVPRRGALGLFHFAIVLPNRASLGSFAHHVLPIGAVSGMADHAVSEAIYLTDPDGLGIEIYADRPRETWHVDPTRQLHMTTEPIDIDGVIAASEGRPWTGLPAGTVMGHIHLHVGDLRQAEAFYHQALGFDKVVWTFPGALFLSAGGYHHHLGTNTWSSGAAAAEDQARLLSWDLELPSAADASAAAQSLIAHGHSARRDADGWHVPDPWGTMMRLTFVSGAVGE